MVTHAPRRGDVWLADLGEPVGHEQGYTRPTIIVSADQLNAGRLGLVVAVPLTRRKRNNASHIEVEPGVSGLSETSYAKVEDVRSISTERLIRRRGSVGPDVLNRIGRTLLVLLDLR